ncbi:MAG: histidine kinase [Gemmatimonadota bacterium]
MKLRIVVGVCLGWMLAGVLWGAQTALGSTLSGMAVIPLGQAIRGALGQMLPWIPVTLAVIALTVRFPLTRARWRRHVVVHVVSAPVLAWVANVLVVLGFWANMGKFQGFTMLARQGVLWATVNFHVALLIYAAILAITQGVLNYQQGRARELELAKVEGQLARAQVQALNAQIRPHFLFNTLHSIGQMWRSGRSNEADAMLDHLGSLFHKVQRSTSRTEVPLSDELDLVREYLAIEQARFRDRMQTTVCAPPETMTWLVPPLLLQPIVENAVRHGLAAISTASRIDVTAAIRADHLELEVRDDGPGVNATSTQPGSGTGLTNTRERLAQLYGTDASLSIADAETRGTVVRISIPRTSTRRTADAYGGD